MRLDLEIQSRTLRLGGIVLAVVTVLGGTAWGSWVLGSCNADGGCALMTRFQVAMEKKDAFVEGYTAAKKQCKDAI